MTFNKYFFFALISSNLINYLMRASIFEQRLQEDLIQGYNTLVRPVHKNDDQLVVRLGLKLMQILDVDEKNQILITKVWVKHIWRDKNLKWNPEEYGNITYVSIPSSNIWIPDIILFNSADGKYEISLMTRAKIYFNGTVIWEPPAIYKSSCTINVEFFPFDVQHCIMKFGSWTYDGYQVDLVHLHQELDEYENSNDDYIPIGIDLEDYLQSHEWDIMNVPATRNIEYPHLDSNEFYPDLTFNITLRRKTLFYTCNLIIPCVCLTFLTVLTFFLPSECGEKICLSISILLCITVFVLLLNDLIPPTSLVVPLIGKYLLFTVILVTLSITVTVVVLNVHFRSPTTHEMPDWARRLFLNVLPKLLLMKRPPSSSSMSASYYTKEFARAFLRQKRENEYFSQQKETNALKVIEKDKPSSYDLNRQLLHRTFKNEHEASYYAKKIRAIKSINEMVEYFRKENEEERVKQEWKYTALVIDRLFLLIFLTACLVGSTSIILQAPSFYDHKTPIDQILSKHF